MSDFKAIGENPSDTLYQQSEIIKVLLIEDNPGDARLVKEMLVEAGANQFSLVHAGLISKGLAFLRDEDYDVILLDLELPDGHGLNNIQQVCTLAPHLPVVILTGLDDETTAIRAVQEGAEDYLVKGQMDSNLLTRAIRYAIERKRVEEKLRESEEKYRTILENIEEGYYEVDLAGNFTFFNDSMCRLLGYSKEELMGMNNRQYTDQENAKRLFRAFNQVYRTGEPGRGFDWKLIRKDGTQRTGEVSFSLKKDASGKPIGFRGIVRDITERKQAEEALRKSEKEYRSVIENIQDVFYRSDITGSLLMGSPSGAKMFGYNTIDEMIGLPLDSFWPDPKDRERLLEQIKATGSVKDFEAVLKKKDGTTFDASFTTYFYYDDNGDFLGTEGIIRDITERKRAEEALHASEAQLSNALKIAHLGHWEYDVASDLFTFSDHFYAIFRTTAEREGGHTMSSAQYAQRFVHPDDRSVVSEEIQKALETTDHHFSRQLEHRIIYGDGEIGYIAVRFFIVKDDQGRTVKTYGVNQDITERKRAEELLRESEAKFQQLFDEAPVGYHVYDTQGRITKVNRTELEMLGYTLEEMLGQPVWKFIGDEETSRNAVLAKIAGTIPPARGFERAYCRKDGTTFPVLIEDRALRDSEGRIIGIRSTIQDITERKQTEEALRESESGLRIIFESIQAGVLIIDPETHLIVDLNPAALKLIGAPKEKIVDSICHKYICPAETGKCPITDLKQNVENAERILLTANGEIRQIIKTVVPVLLQGRRYLLESFVDITERKRVEEALRESENKFRDLAEKSLVGIYLIQDGIFKYANARLAEMNGYTTEELIDKTGPKDFVFPEDWPMVEEKIRKRLSGEIESLHFEFRAITKDNRIINVEVYGSRTMYQGRPAVVGTLLDITDRKRAEERLQESEEKFRQLAENIREVFYISEQGIIQYVSPAYMEIWGRTPQSLYEEPKSILDTIHPEDRDRVKRSFWIKNQGEIEEVYRIVRPDGSIRWIKDHSFPIHDDSGKTHRFVGIAADITDSKLGEEKLKYISLHDSLTGLYNRIYFEEEMSRIEKGRYDTVGILSCDVDGLKLVNDTLGHDQGDHLLIAAARVIRECFREGDLVARIGGDEFSVLLPDTTELAVENACQRIQEAVTSYNATNPELPLSISVGFAINDGAYRNLKDLFKEADNHMYRKKLYGTKSVRSTIVKTLINTLKARDRTTENHIIRLEKLLASIAAFIGLPESTKSDLSLLAKFHDIGKVGIADSILFKEGPLTSEEWMEMKRHCEIGYRIALSAPELVPIADWILKHHEWWNGQGYPLNIEGEEIPIECRLLAIADTYEALTSTCLYRKTFSHREAVAELISYSGKQFDPKLLKKFLQMFETYSPESEFNATALI